MNKLKGLNMKKIIFLSIGFIVMIIFASITALACSCPTVGSMTRIGSESLTILSLRNAKVVFSGEVVGIKKIPKTRMLQIRIEVKESWKKVLPKEITITTELGGCGYDFQVGTEYLVFANSSDDGNLSTGLCLRNRELYKATEELEILGKGNQPRRNKLSN
jgi:hypothetical protein